MMVSVGPDLSRNYHKFMQWDITDRCNLRCAHCRSTEFYAESDNLDLPLEANKRIAEELYLNGVDGVHFLGGEPLIRPDFLDLVEYMRGLGMWCGVNTNATLLTEEVAQRILDLGMRHVTVSLDGADTETNDAIRGRGVFDRVCENTERLTYLRDQQRKPTRVLISTTVVRGSIGRLGEMPELARELGVDSLMLSPLRIMGRARDAVANLCVSYSDELAMGEEIARNLAGGNPQNVQLGTFSPLALQYLNEEYGTAFPIYDGICSALTRKGYIQPDGALFPCQSLTDAGRDLGVIGSVPRRSLVDHSFDEIWNSPEYRRIKALLFSRQVDRYMLPCAYCRYFRVLCYPCPLGALRGRRGVHEVCLEAMTRLAERRGQAVPWADMLRRTGRTQPQSSEVKAE